MIIMLYFLLYILKYVPAEYLAEKFLLDEYPDEYHAGWYLVLTFGGLSWTSHSNRSSRFEYGYPINVHSVF